MKIKKNRSSKYEYDIEYRRGKGKDIICYKCNNNKDIIHHSNKRYICWSCCFQEAIDNLILLLKGGVT